MAEQNLEGGIANAGKVVRVGPHVLRPSSPHTESIHDRIESFARRSVQDGDAQATEVLARTGGIEKYARRRRWWTSHHEQFATALR